MENLIMKNNVKRSMNPVIITHNMFSFQFSNLTDILIIVSRWYGGIHLGADRFKHYSSAARDLINHLEIIQNPVST